MSKREPSTQNIDGGQPHCKSARRNHTDNDASGDSEPLLLPSSGLSNLLGTQSDSSEMSANILPSFDLEEALDDIDDYEGAAKTILNNIKLKDAIVNNLVNDTAIKNVILNNISTDVTLNFKHSLKTSKLTANNRERDFLLGINPRDLCLEFKALFPEAFTLVVRVLLGIEDDEKVFKSPILMKNVALMFSLIARLRNRKATAYALFLGMVARDGGLGEES